MNCGSNPYFTMIIDSFLLSNDLPFALWSVAVGAIGAFHQNNLARWLAYGSTGHMGVIIGCFISFDFAGIAASILYMIIYKLLSTLIFAWILAHLLRISIAGSKSMLCVSLSYLHDFTTIYMGNANFPAALAISASWLAHGGMPPFSGFLAKMLIFNSLVSKGEIFLVISLLAASGISIYVYIRFMKNLYFEKMGTGQPGEGCIKMIY